jgi:hypothetical protein
VRGDYSGKQGNEIDGEKQHNPADTDCLIRIKTPQCIYI